MALSFYNLHSGALFVSPGGQSEPGAAFAQAGFSYGAIDVLDGHPYEDWQKTIQQITAGGGRVPVWGRVRNIAGWKVAPLLDVGALHHCPVFLNIEDEFKTKSPKLFEAEIMAWKKAHPLYTREIVISTVGWLYNDVDYSPIAHRPVQLQVMVTDMKLSPADLPRVTSDCIYHAHMKGFKDIGVQFQANDSGGNVAKPSWYDFWKGPRCYFTGDWIGSQKAWAAWSPS